MTKRIFLGCLIFTLGWTVYSEGKHEGKSSPSGSSAGTGSPASSREASSAVPASAGTEEKAASKGDISYAFGMMIGSNLKELALSFDYNAFMQGMQEVIEDKTTALTLDEAIAKVQTAYTEAMTKQNEAAQTKEKTFLAENAEKPGIQVTPSGLQYEVLAEGAGEKPGPEDTVLVHYRGTFIDGTVFDSSYDREEPTEFPLYAVIPGWSEGVQLMNPGSKYRLYIPSELAYGSQGGGNVIPGYSTLIFEVELLSIVPEDTEPESDFEEWQDTESDFEEWQ
ncbi:MAG: FKBP-type peptidyl-prolyl cis-trans isomerase [Spirochaetaceae bacterium]|jgi:FKBP-type peptidyl-prolyl cis-trans isomerase FkpA|nr:FKBP-type peptidyl-prolyl cis-trans isomerase [Spirochaetaceae bacterium]